MCLQTEALALDRINFRNPKPNIGFQFNEIASGLPKPQNGTKIGSMHQKLTPEKKNQHTNGNTEPDWALKNVKTALIPLNFKK